MKFSSPTCTLVVVIAARSFAPTTTALAPAPINPHAAAHSSALLFPTTSIPAFRFDSQPDSLSSHLHPLVSGVPSLRPVATREVQLTYGMLKSNLPTTVCLGTLCTIACGIVRATSGISSPPVAWVRLLARSITWYLGYSYFFDIGNQMTGVEEDKLNSGDLAFKAERPLASGAMSMTGAKVRYALSGLYFMGISKWLGGFQLSACAVAWIVSSHLSNFCGWDKHFATKNYFTMSSGAASMLVASRVLAGEFSTSVLPPLLAAAWIGLCMDVQDFRDEVGDRASGRHTTAVLWGVKKARQLWVGNVVVASTGLGYILRNCMALPDTAILSAAVALSIRTLKNKTVKEDHASYNGICALGAMIFFRAPFWAQVF